jgi:hypothetical protein
MSLWILTNANSGHVATDLQTICPDPALQIDFGTHAAGSVGSGAVSFFPAPTTSSVGCQMVQELVASPVAIGLRGETDVWSAKAVPGWTLDQVGGVTIGDKHPAPTLIEIVYDISPCGGRGIWVTDSTGNHITVTGPVALFHEMAHAHDRITGVFTGVPAVDEASAVAQENIFRASLGMAARAGHSGGCNPPPPPAPSHRCFIATAAFGSIIEPEVQFLRSFRDDVLRRTRAGQAFFDTYFKHYYRVSPSIVSVMQDPEVRQVVRWSVVTPIVRYLELLVKFPDAPLDGVPEPWRAFLAAMREDLKKWTGEIELPRTFVGLDAPTAAQELGILLRYVLRSETSRGDYLADLEQRGEIPLAGSSCQLKTAAARLAQCGVRPQEAARVVAAPAAEPCSGPVSTYMNQTENLDFGSVPVGDDVYQIVITCLGLPLDQIAVFYNQTDNPNNVYFLAENNLQLGQVAVFNLGPCSLLQSYNIGFYWQDQKGAQQATIPDPTNPIFQGQSTMTPALDQIIHPNDPPCKSAWSFTAT